MSLLNPGTLFVYEIANFELVAQYGFLIKSVGDGVSFGAGQLGRKTALADFKPALLITCSEEALEAGKGPVLMHRGQASAGEEVELFVGDQAHELAEEDARVLDRDDEAYKVIKRFGGEVLVATGGDDGSLLVVARSSHEPIILFLEWDGECHVSYLRREEG